jgi:oxygen-dependent protoporphyrinogen oxidase
MQAALPQFVEMEQQYGGLIRAIRRSRSADRRAAEPGRDDAAGVRYGLFVAPRRGMESFLQALANRLSQGTIRLGTRVESLSRDVDGKWLVHLDGGGRQCFDAVLIAVPAYLAATLLQAVTAAASEELRGIPYATAAVVVIGLRRDQVRRSPDGFGIVVPMCENRRILAASLASIKFPGRAPDDSLQLRVFVGGACQSELADLPERELEQLVLSELDELLGIARSPQLIRVIRWRQAMPQYHVGHRDRILRLERMMQEFPTLALAGNAYQGVGIPSCIRSGELAADKLAAAG